MTPTSAAVTRAELVQLRLTWKGGASRIYFGCCATCRHVAGADERPLLVAKQERSRRGFECFDCFAARVGPKPRRSRNSRGAR